MERPTPIFDCLVVRRHAVCRAVTCDAMRHVMLRWGYPMARWTAGAQHAMCLVGRDNYTGVF